METNNNMKDFNIAEALRYAPKGLKLYSPLLGEVKLEKVSDHADAILVITKYNSERVFFEDGKYDSNGECLLFPSVNHRCWNHWQNTLFLESIGSVCVDTITGNKFILGEDGTYFGDNTGNSYHFLIDDEDSGNYLLNSRYATPEETKEFFNELEKRGYKWDGKMVVKSTSQPKFKEGDWIVDNCNNVWQVVEVSNNFYRLKNINESESLPKIKWVNETFHLWTIQDAKDGDVLACGDKVTDCPFIFHNLTEEQNPRSYCGINTLRHFQDNDENGGNWCYSDEVRPATKEQRDLLFQKIKEEGYEWNADTKKLIKTTIPIPKFKVGDIVKFDRPSATVKREILSIDFENERYLTRRTDIGGAIKEFIYFCEQDDYVIVGSHDRLSNLSIEVKVSVLADEILALKEKLLALEKLAKDSEIKIDALECGGKPFQCSDKAGDNVTLEEMKK